MKIRAYQESDCLATYQLFYETVHQVNCQDYAPEQLAVWAKPSVDEVRWHQSLAANYGVVAEIDQQLVGFGDIDETGYLDRLYVHHLHQGHGIAKAIVDTLEKQAGETGQSLITVAASITAKPFFLKRGYRLVRQQQVERDGQKLTNFLLDKQVIEKD